MSVGRVTTLPAGVSYPSISLTSSPLSLIAEATPRQLSEELDQSCSLVEIDGFDIGYGSRVSPLRPITDYMKISHRMPTCPTSTARPIGGIRRSGPRRLFGSGGHRPDHAAGNDRTRQTCSADREAGLRGYSSISVPWRSKRRWQQSNGKALADHPSMEQSPAAARTRRLRHRPR